ncbi:ABC transporter ATP-binding protein [uncultured Alistipes sp.]|jgi:cobalt/nickel transport system ATP-binding protein|uniref:energy-coupling factor ABC transporter ATP-binding protein n=1 Tax=uncultured Alistipes sp. TaxID=538949 RepID=UPI002591D499|nr:ABC transporter ATP-binding protein [uncultured Alistipes sp.]
MSHHYLQFDRVSYRYPGGREALRDVSLRITHGEKVALVGANGTGKSTLLLLAAGLLLPTDGEVSVGGIGLTPRTLPIVRQTVGLVFQNPDHQLFMPTVEEDVAFGPANMGLTPEEIEARVTAALESVGALHLRKESPCRLSGGQKRSAAIATVLAMEPSVLVLDEPTSDLDPRARRQTLELLKRFSHTMLVATHDMEMARELCPRMIVLRDGEIAADGATETLFRDTDLLDACGLEPPCRMR